MSVLSFPRLYFQGFQSWDPDTTNNYGTLWDPSAAALVWPKGVTTPDEYKKYVLDNSSTSGNWNVYGSHACDFVQYGTSTSLITGGTTGGDLVTKDPVIGQPLSMPGRMVDLQCLASDTTQYFFEQFSVGPSSQPWIAGPRVERMHSRWINFSRNLDVDQDPRIQIAGIAAVMWQTTFDKQRLTLNPRNSPLLAEFARKLESDEILGLMLRMTSYRALYFQNGVFNDLQPRPTNNAEAQQFWEQGLLYANPAYTVVTGTLGLWRPNELVSMAGGRYLLPAQATAAGDPTGLGPVVAHYHPCHSLLSLDFGSAIPETGFDLAKQDFGTLTVKAGGTTVATIPRSKYDRAAYQANGGIVDVKVTNPAAIGGDLTISGTLAGAPLDMYAEQPVTIQTSQKNVYLDEGGHQTISLYASLKGDPAPAGTEFQVAVYGMNESGPVPLPQTVKVGRGGRAQLTVRAERPGFRFYRFAHVIPGSQVEVPPPPQIDPMVDFYFGVRTLPFDDHDARIPDSALTWDFIYRTVLEGFDLNPGRVMAMFNIALSSQQVWDNPNGAKLILQRTAKDAFETLGAMPITRELSNGKRELLHRWCRLVIAGREPKATAPLARVMSRPVPRAG